TALRHLSLFFFQAEDGIRDLIVTGVQTCALPISPRPGRGYAEGLPAGSPPPVRSSDPNVQNTPSPGGPKYEGDAASQASPSGDRSEERRVGKECRWRGRRADSKQRQGGTVPAAPC